MKIVILAAGKGSRLSKSILPKPLTLLSDGKSILQHQIEALEQYFSRHDIMVVVGYHKELIIEANDDLLFVYAPGYAKENTSKSLLRAIKKCEDDFLWINGDLLFHPSIIGKLIAQKRTTMVVTKRPVGEEEVKYTTTSEGRITAVSKTIVAGEGEAIGINFFTAESLPLLQETLEACQDSDYFEKAIEMCISEGLKVWSCPVENSLCTEIDFPSDLEHANFLLKTWQFKS
ncbi:MAG: phosphocholine cytidylyltransferase family protein [Parachlamydiaceae bacterium]|nr:phosphocholine cytidylyltransferase family protein [Parachlamydiaceae bacterium]